MMENISDFIKSFRERLASPFFFSFVIAWIFLNWQVTISLLWYNSNLYPKEGDLINFIDSNTSNWQSIGFPLISAVAYTGFLKNLISAFVTFGIKWGGNLNLSITRESKVPMSKFLTYRNLYIQTNKDLEKVIEDERKTIQDFDEQRQKNLKLEADNVVLNGELIKLKSDKEHLNLKLDAAKTETEKLKEDVQRLNHYTKNNKNLIKTYKDIKFMNGTWKFRYDNALRNAHYEDTFYIIDGIISTVHGTKTEGTFRIIEYFHDVVNNKVLLILKFIEDSPERNFIQRTYAQAEAFQTKNNMEYATYSRLKYEPVFIHDLEVRDDNKLVGKENVEALISYQRVN